MTKSKAQKQQEAAANKAANENVTLPTGDETLPQIEGEVGGQVVNLDSKAAKKPAAPAKTAEELAAEKEAADKLDAEKEAVKQALETEVAELETRLETEVAAETAATAVVKATREELKIKKAALSGKTVAAPSPRIEGKGVIEVILELWHSGLTRPQIIKKGYNKSTVQRQVGEEIARRKAAGQPIQDNAPVADAAPASAPSVTAEPVVESEGAVTADDVV